MQRSLGNSTISNRKRVWSLETSLLFCRQEGSKLPPTDPVKFVLLAELHGLCPAIVALVEVGSNAAELQ